MNKMKVSETIRAHQTPMTQKMAEEICSSGYAYLVSEANLRQVRKCRTTLSNHGCLFSNSCESCSENRNKANE